MGEDGLHGILDVPARELDLVAEQGREGPLRGFTDGPVEPGRVWCLGGPALGAEGGQTTIRPQARAKVEGGPGAVEALKKRGLANSSDGANVG